MAISMTREDLMKAFENNMRLVRNMEQIVASVNALLGDVKAVNDDVTVSLADIQAIQRQLTELQASLGSMSRQNSIDVSVIKLSVATTNSIISCLNPLDDYASVNVATFNNSPVSGDPSRWAGIEIQGEMYAFPLFKL